MIRNILVGLDGARSTTELAIEWAKRFGAELTGVAVIDDLPQREPGLYITYTSFKVLAYMERLARMRTDAAHFVEEFKGRCAVLRAP